MRFDGPLDARKIVKKVKRKFWFDKVVHEWEVLSDFRFYHDDKNPTHFMLVKKGFVTDLASVPGILGFVIQKDGVFAQSAVNHDNSYQYRGNVVWIEQEDGSLIQGEPLTRKRQDQAFLDGMEVLGTNLPTRVIMWRAVRRFGWIRYPKNP